MRGCQVEKEKIDVTKPDLSSDYDSRTPLHLACRRAAAGLSPPPPALTLWRSDGSYAVANWLLSQGAPVNAVDRFGFTCLEGAARGKHVELVKLLRGKGALVKQDGILVDLEASELAGVHRSAEGGEMDWGICVEDVQLGGILGEGAFGTVHKGDWRGTPVAVKTLKRLTEAAADAVAMAEFRTELAMIRHLHHPHVVQFLGVMTSPTDGAPLLVTEFMELGSLADWFKKPTGFTQLQALDLCLDCCRGMSYLHGRQPAPVLHRDLKPNNLMLTVGMRLKIGDFGLSKTLSVRNRLPQDLSQAYKLTGETGSYRYMAPEVFRHEYYGPPVDVYAFSMVTYQMYHRRVPFDGMNPVDAARAAAFERRRPALEPLLPMPRELQAVVRDAWLPSPGARPSFQAIIQRLTPLRAKLAASAGAEGACCALQ